MNDRQGLIPLLQARGELYIHLANVIQDDDPRSICFLGTMLAEAGSGGHSYEALRCGAVAALCDGDLLQPNDDDSERWDLVLEIVDATRTAKLDEIRKWLAALSPSVEARAEALIRDVAKMYLPRFDASRKGEFPDSWAFFPSLEKWVERQNRAVTEAKKLKDADIDSTLKRLLAGIACRGTVLTVDRLTEDNVQHFNHAIADCRAHLLWSSRAA